MPELLGCRGCVRTAKSVAVRDVRIQVVLALVRTIFVVVAQHLKSIFLVVGHWSKK